jgi:protein TonB
VDTTVASSDPIAALCGALRSDVDWTLTSFVLAASIHVAAALAMPRVAALPPVDIDHATNFVDIELPKPVVPPVETVTPVPKAPDEPRPAARAPTAAARRTAPAAAVLTKQDDPADAVDLTNTFVTGSASSYSGGATMAGAAGAEPSAAPQASTHALPREEEPSRSGPDRSSRAHLAGGARWRCPFPSEADAAQVDRAIVRLRVEVDASGKARGASVLRDPGLGFGREAMRCALTTAWNAALDRAGSPVVASVVVDVRFER